MKNYTGNSRRIVATRDTCAGAPRVNNHRITVADILDYCMSEQIVTMIQGYAYSCLTKGQIRAAIKYAQKQTEKMRIT